MKPERVFARLSYPNRKRVECGYCGETLVRRNETLSGPRDAMVRGFLLAWGPEWEDKDGTLVRYGWERLESGKRPTRRGWRRDTLSWPTLEPHLPRRKAFGWERPALCRCGVINDLDPVRLDVDTR
jgi:hypothetical protein